MKLVGKENQETIFEGTMFMSEEFAEEIHMLVVALLFICEGVITVCNLTMMQFKAASYCSSVKELEWRWVKAEISVC